MLWVKVGTHIGDHERFLAAGAVARDLYFWGLTYSGKHELDGEIPMVAVLASPWGAGGAANIKVASKLVALGLWARTDAGFLILRWEAQGNQTKAQLLADRTAARERIKAKRSGNVRANAERTSPDVPTSTSTSLSGSGSGSRIALVPDGPPEWWQSTLDTVEMATGEKLPAAEAWLRYDGHRAGKGIAPNTRDAQYWLTTVMVPERRKARDDAHHREKRDKQFDDKRRFSRDGPEKPPAPTREQSARMAEELAARVKAARAAGGSR